MKLMGSSAIDVESIRADFPILCEQPGKARLVYLDSASSSQHPRAVLEAMDHYYETTHANVHRGVYPIAEEATALYEKARAAAGRLINAQVPAREIVFTKNVTEAINLVAYTWGRQHLHQGDVVVLSEMEHHANIVPWLMLKEERGIELRFLRFGPDYRLDLSNFDELLKGAKLVGLSAASNVLGTVNDLKPIAARAHEEGALVLGDGAQLVPHRRVDVQDLDLDFFGFTSHKMLGPTGIGVLYARRALLEEMPPFLGGGEMIADVRTDGFSTNEVPWKFEAGTPPIAEAVGLHAAIEYLESIGLDAIERHEAELTKYAIERLRETYPELKILGPEPDGERRSGVISFSFGDAHPHDIAQVLGEKGICVRAGHHCAKPLMRCLGLSATTRASLYLYNDEEDIEALVKGLSSVRELFL